MRWIGAFNVAYGGLGLAAAAYLGRADAIFLCVWVMASGLAMRSRRLGALMRRVVPVLRRRGQGG